MDLLLAEANQIRIATVELLMGLAGRLESGNVERIVLTGGFPSRVACEFGIVEGFRLLELSH